MVLVKVECFFASTAPCLKASVSAVDGPSAVGRGGEQGVAVSVALGSILRETLSGSPNVAELSELVSADPAFCVAVLKVVNSPMYGRRNPVASVRKAVQILGVEALRNLALCQAASSGRSARDLYPFDLERFWEDSLRRAAAAECLASTETFSKFDSNEAFTIGLIIDLPLVELVSRRRGRAEAWMNATGLNPARRREVEQQLFGRSHDQLAAELVETWGIPDSLAIPMIHHHSPQTAPPAFVLRCQLANLAETVAAVYSADDTAPAWKRARKRLYDELGLERDAADELIGSVAGRVERAARVLGLRVPKQPSLTALDRRARSSAELASLSRRDLVRSFHRLTARNEALSRRLAQMQTELEAARGIDELTGLAAESVLAQRTVFEVRRVARSGSGLAVLAMKIGAAEDDAECTVAVGLGNTMRTTDLIARRAPGCYAILLPDATLAGAIVAARRAAEGVAKECEIASLPPVRTHFGVCFIEGRPDGDIEPESVAAALLDRASEHAEVAAQEGETVVRTGGETLLWRAPVSHNAA